MVNTSYKMIVGGLSGVGKSTFIDKLCNNSDNKIIQPTLVWDIKNTEINYSNKVYKLEIWDCAGQDEYSLQNKTFFVGSNIIILVFDLTEVESFKKLEVWMDKINEINDIKKSNILLLGNKNELNIKVDKEEINSFIKKYNLKYEEFSVYLSSKKDLENLLINSFFKETQTEPKLRADTVKLVEKNVNGNNINNKLNNKKKGCC